MRRDLQESNCLTAVNLKENRMSFRIPVQNKKPLILAFVAVAVGVLLIAAPAVQAQTATTAGPTAKANDASKLDMSDRGMIDNLAQANYAEIETGKLALEKSQNADIKKFAQNMVDDHGKALDEVKALAQAKNVKLPEGPGPVDKTKALAMKALSGNTFDREYVRFAGVGAHESTVKLLQKIQKDGKDPDFKALATKLLPTVEHHLGMAKMLAAAK
jgi:putative membrane protein